MFSKKYLLVLVVLYVIVLFTTLINAGIFNDSEAHLNNHYGNFSKNEDYYVEVGSSENHTFHIEVGIVNFSKNIFSQGVLWSQEIVIENPNDSFLHQTINLMDYIESRDFVLDSQQILVYLNNTIISESFGFIINQDKKSTEVYTIEYFTPPVDFDLECFDKNLLETIPEESKIVYSDISPKTIISKDCNLKLKYPNSSIDYSKVKIEFSDLFNQEILSIYYSSENRCISDISEVFI
jgi:hypothetical protein